MRLHICGTRGSTPAPGDEFAAFGGHTSCVAVSRDHAPPDLLLDAGTGIRRVTALLGGAAFRGSVLLSHLHWDHTHGLPFFTGGDDPDSRVDVYLPERGEDARATLEAVMAPPHFPITPSQLEGRWRFSGLEEGSHRIEGYDVMAREIPHKGGRTFGYRVSHDGSSIAYLSDHDSQYLEDEWPARANFGHSTPSYAIGLARAAGARSLLMFHHSPTRTDDQLDALTEQWQSEPSLEVRAAAEGEVIDVAAGDH